MAGQGPYSALPPGGDKASPTESLSPYSTGGPAPTNHCSLLPGPNDGDLVSTLSTFLGEEASAWGTEARERS